MELHEGIPVHHICILHGDDAFSIKREIRGMTDQFSSASEAELNTQRLDGKTASLEEFQTAVSTLPFFGGGRLVILESMSLKMDKSRQERFIKILDGTPESTQLVLVIEDHPRWRKEGSQWVRSWDLVNETHWLNKWMAEHPNVEKKDFPLPDVREMDGWITKEAMQQGGKFTSEAARELAQSIGNNTFIASQEIAKLLMYVNRARPVARDDVIALVSEAGSSDVFAMLDAMLEGRTNEAVKMLHRLLDDTPPEVILGAMAHRFRQLIQVREALDSGEDLKVLISQRVLFAGKQAEKTSSQARRFSLSELSSIYHRLLELDVQSKSSQLDPGTALEILTIEVAKKTLDERQTASHDAFI